MIIRLSEKLRAKIKVAPTNVLPPDPNPFADWSASVFTAARVQFVLITNTVSLYSMVFPCRGITNADQFVSRALDSLGEFLDIDGLESVFSQFIVTARGSVQFSKALNRSVTGSMNDLIGHSKLWLVDRPLPLLEIARRLNDIPFSSLEFCSPRQVFQSLPAPGTAPGAGLP